MLRKMVISLMILVASVSINYGQTIPEKKVIRMGKASDDVLQGQNRLGPIVTYLATRLKDMGIEEGKVVLASDNNNDTVVQYLKSGKVDIVIQGAASALEYKIKAKAIPILQIWRQEIVEYSSFIFVRKDSGIRRLDDLRGKIIAFEDAGSTGSYFLPKYSMELRGLDLIKLSSNTSDVPKEKVGYVFAGSEINISTWVFHNKVTAGALNTTDWANQKDNPKSYRKEFTVIHETQKIPRVIAVVRENLDPKLIDRIKEELIKMHQTSEGKAALQTSTYKLNKFEEIPEGNLDTTEKMVRQILVEQRR